MKNRKVDMILFVSVIALILFGLLMIYSVSSKICYNFVG